MTTDRHCAYFRTSARHLAETLGIHEGTVRDAKYDPRYDTVDLLIEAPGLPRVAEGMAPTTQSISPRRETSTVDDGMLRYLD